MKTALLIPFTRLPGLAAVCLAVILAGCDTGEEPLSQGPTVTGQQDYATREKPEPAITRAMATIAPTSKGNAQGTVEFHQPALNAVMQVKVNIEGLQPGPHGFHVHEFGDCSADDASSAGGHFNPLDARHGSPDDEEHHVGDMGNIEADENGKVSTELELPGLTFSGPASILDRAVVVHGQRDDLESQPAGNAGPRIGCGVIEVIEEQETL